MIAEKLKGSAVAANYIEDVFSTYLYTGNGSTQTITNGIDLAGGLVWIKSRSAATDHKLTDTVRGATKALISDTTGAETTDSTGLTAFSSTGFSLGASSVYNTNAATYASYTFRKRPKFFDVVTYTGDGVNRTISHNLGSVPGCIIVKRTNTIGDWAVYHRGLTSAAYSIQLNLTNAQASATTVWNSTAPTSSVFSVGTDATVNASGSTYVAYLFAHDAGGFGLTGTDNVISCGSYTGNNGAGQSIYLGFEPQWLLVKNTSQAGQNWVLIDNMRQFDYSGFGWLYPNSYSAEAVGTGSVYCSPTANGFRTYGNNTAVDYLTDSYIYIAIRRGPMKVPTDGTKVFAPVTSSASSGTYISTGFPVDMQIEKYRAGIAANAIVDRMRGVSTNSTGVGSALTSTSTAAEGTASGGDSLFWDNTGFQMPSNLGGISDIFYNFKRAPGFFDEVCYTGNGTANRQITHNLTVAPELILLKCRSCLDAGALAGGLYSGVAFHKDITTGNGTLFSYGTFGNEPFNFWSRTNTISASSTSYITVGGAGGKYPVNQTSDTYVAYLFASCPGVSKVGSYTGNGSTQTINCGFTGGARFVLIKRTDSTGDWYVWDSARGIVSGNDPYLLLNSTAAEVTSTDYVDTYSAGFEISSTAPAAINASGGTFIYLAIA